jgi:hypothetical protein
VNRPTRRTTIFSPSSCHSSVEPGPTPSFRRTAAGTEICPCAVRREWAIAMCYITAVLHTRQASGGFRKVAGIAYAFERPLIVCESVGKRRPHAVPDTASVPSDLAAILTDLSAG